MSEGEYADKFMSRAKQDIKICENEHELQIYITGLLENIDYWQNEYDYMKKYRDNLQQKNNQLKERIDKVIYNLEKSIESINKKLIKDKTTIEVKNGVIQNMNDYQIVRLKAIRMKCKELLEILKGEDNDK